MKQNKLIISPKTKVLHLIETYPQLEDVLISYVPAFKKLKNPILRKTVAKVATLQQAAKVGNVKVEDLINHLRKEVGQDLISLKGGDTEYITEKPDWFDETRIKETLDIREMLDAGEQPVNQVVSDLNKIKDDEIYKLIAPFLPAPLIDKATSLNMQHWVSQAGNEPFVIYFTRK